MMHVIINTLGNAEIKYYLLKDFYSIICFTSNVCIILQKYLIMT